jgi:hypothetical protein
MGSVHIFAMEYIWLMCKIFLFNLKYDEFEILHWIRFFNNINGLALTGLFDIFTVSNI